MSSSVLHSIRYPHLAFFTIAESVTPDKPYAPKWKVNDLDSYLDCYCRTDIKQRRNGSDIFTELWLLWKQ